MGLVPRPRATENAEQQNVEQQNVEQQNVEQQNVEQQEMYRGTEYQAVLSLFPLITVAMFISIHTFSLSFLQIETESNKKVLANLEKITEDYQQMKKENATLMAKVKQK